MYTLLKKILILLPLEVVIDAFLDFLETYVKKTSNTIDDKALKVLRVILDEVISNDKGKAKGD